jgi:tight adherence protein B
MDPLALAAAVAVLVTTVLGMLVLSSVATATAGNTARQRLQGLFGASVLEQPTVGSALREQKPGDLLGMGQSLLGREWAAKTAMNLDQADMHLRVGEYVALRIGCGLFLFAVALMLIPSRPAAMVIGSALGVVGYLAPAFLVRIRKERRSNKLEGQLEEALTLVSSSLKAGFGLLQSLDQAAQQIKHPLATELKRAIHDINVGSSMEEALLTLSQRANSYDLEIVITAVIIQRTVGGNLGEILNNVAHTMRERGRIRGQIRALTSQQRMTGYVLAALPIAIAGILFLVAGDYMMPLFTTVAGQVLLVAAGTIELIGALVIKRILAIEV